MRRCGTQAKHAEGFRSVVSVLLRGSWETFLYTLKAGPAGGLRPPSGPATIRRLPGRRPALREVGA